MGPLLPRGQIIFGSSVVMTGAVAIHEPSWCCGEGRHASKTVHGGGNMHPGAA